MPNLSQKGFSHYLVLLVIVIGIAVGVYLTQNPQIFKSRASLNPTGAQYESTPKSDVSQYPKPQNPIQIGFVYGVLSPMSADELTYISKEVDYFFFDQSSLAKTTENTSTYKTYYDQTGLWNQISLLKNYAQDQNRVIKIGSHGGMPFGAAPWHIIFNYLGHPTDPAVENYFLHRNGNPVIYNGHWQIRDYNLNSDATRQKLIESWNALLDHHPQLDGIFLDGMNIPSAGLFSELQSGCDEGDCSNLYFWKSPMISVSQHITQLAQNRGKDYFYNGIFEIPDDPNWKAATMDPPGISLNAGFVQYAHGALSEHFHAILQSPQTFRKYMDGMKWITDQQKKVVVWAQPQTFCVIASNGASTTCPNSTITVNGKSYPINLNLERFYLASYLLIHQNPYTYFGYNPGPFYTMPTFFYADWNKDYGTPQGNFVGPANGDGLFLRSYSNGLVIVNPSDQSYPVHLPSSNLREWDPYTGPISPQDVIIPPKSGRFYFNNLEFPVTVSGKLYDQNTTQPVGAGMTLETCPSGTRTNPVIKSDGTFSFQITKNSAYCIRGPQISGYAMINAVNHTPTATKTNSYEWQVSGVDCPGVDKTSPLCQGDLEDRSVDSGLDLAYSNSQNISQTPAPNTPQTPAPTLTPAPSSIHPVPTIPPFPTVTPYPSSGTSSRDAENVTNPYLLNVVPVLTATPKPSVAPANTNVIDFNGDGKINSADINYMYRKLRGN